MEYDSCLLFDTVGLNAFTSEALREYRAAAEGACDVFAVVHNKTGIDRPFEFDSGAIYLTDQQIFEEVTHCKDVSRGIIPGNVDLKMIRAMRELPQYRRYIWVEYDVFCTGELRSAIRELLKETDDVDFAASFISARKNDNWVWWDSLVTPRTAGMKASDVVVRAFLPLSVYSREFIRFYETQLGEGWAGHQEVTVGTIASHYGFAVKDLSKSVSKPPFTSFPQFAVNGVTRLEDCIPQFVHPAKNFDDRARIIAQISTIRNGALSSASD